MEKKPQAQVVVSKKLKKKCKLSEFSFLQSGATATSLIYNFMFIPDVALIVKVKVLKHVIISVSVLQNIFGII